MAQIFSGIALVCIACIVILSLAMHWYVKKKADTAPKHAGQIVLRGSFIRMVLCIAAVIFFLLSSVIK